MRIHTLDTTLELDGTPEEVFPFFADARNLEAITPPLLRFRVVTPGEITMQLGTHIQYSLSLHGVPVSWQTLIQRWDPPHAFVDTQIRGPYALWHHTHTFESLDGGRMLMRDTVRYALPFQPFGELALPLVKRDVGEIFRFRAERVPALISASRR